MLRLLLVMAAISTTIAADFPIKLGNGIELVIEGKWEVDKGSIRGGGTGKYLCSARGIKSGDFTIEATLSIDRLNGTAASFMLDGNHFGFDGRGGMIFVEGPEFGKTRAVGKTADFIEAGKPFAFTAHRAGNDLVFTVDRKEVWKTRYPKASIQRFGFRPHRAAMTITAFTASGDFLPAPVPALALYRSGDGGYHTYRIPALLTTKKGALLAFCEGRKSGGGDAGDIDLLVKRSEDGGRTWSPQQVVWNDKGNTCGNPAPVLDRETGKIFLVSTWNLGRDHEGQIISGKSKDTRRVFVLESKDDGRTWSKPREITDGVKKPDWTWYATGPGSGIQMTGGAHKGRLIVACDHIEKKSRKYFSHIIYSDDHGKTWQLGGSTPTDKVNECMVTELSGGKLMLNMRNYDRRTKSRAISTSTDGGMTWSALYHDPVLIEPICQAGFISYAPGDRTEGDWILFSNPASQKGRVGMTVRLSRDGGKTWPVSKLLHAGPSAYSDLTVLSSGDIACLYEGGAASPYAEIRFVRLSLKELHSVMASGHCRPEKPGLLPKPQTVRWRDSCVTLATVRLIDRTGKRSKKMSFNLKTLEGILEKNSISIEDKGYPIIVQLGKVDAPYQADDAYRLSVEDKGAALTANTSAGIFYGIQTIRQLVVHQHGKTTIASCEIIDYPAFKIRGFMHDVGRNFQSLEQLKQHIRIMAMYKYSVFHWHLTDYFGWRLESKVLPELQSKKAFARNPGKYYTQAEFKEMLEFCRLRNIIVIPEFDSPGHSDAFRKGLGIKTMKDPRAKEAMVKLIDELCTLAPKERMPYIHVGTDEARRQCDKVNRDYLPAVHDAVRRNGREVIGWWRGMHVQGDSKQILQTWAQFGPLKDNPQIDSRSNYVNHLSALDAPIRMFFQQPCRLPHGNKRNLGGILCYWPDMRVSSEKAELKIAPVYLSTVAYSEAVWTGLAKNQSRYWAIIPPDNTQEYKAYVEFESRIAEQRDRFLSHLPFLFVKTSHIPWKVTATLNRDDAEHIDIVEEDKPSYRANGKTVSWRTQIYHGGCVHVRHCFDLGAMYHKKEIPKRHTCLYAQTYVHSPENQTVDAWVSFNTPSSSDFRVGSAKKGCWSSNIDCNIWINGKRIAPPDWKQSGRNPRDIENPIDDEIYTNRPPTRIPLRKGWNRVLVRSAPAFKWSFTFTPILWNGVIAREVPELTFAVEPR